MLASVVSEGSPGSFLLADNTVALLVLFPMLLRAREEESAATIDLVRGRFVGGGALLLLPVDSGSGTFLLCFADVEGAAESSPSSPEASREEGCSSSVVADWGMLTGLRCEALRFRLPAGEDDDWEEDMACKTQRRCPLGCSL